ncbi:MAG TPA: NAD(P)(+) transhydrogenase (Re/Si-specific) subunit beta, partial [Arenicellales bacterium]|nr:NAD(P)(+) transhydrogenase (Re/Si-specific) subunit beta [Arenicellales bacterium]
MSLGTNVLALAYLVSAALFILGLKGLTHPSSARRGNSFAISGMVIAVVATLLDGGIHSYGFIIAGIIIGGTIGTVIAMRIEMTAMPQLVALLHSFVGLAAVLVAIGTWLNRDAAGLLNPTLAAELAVGTFIGAVTFTGSLVAFGKLQGLVSGAPLSFSGQHLVNLLLGIAMVGCAIWFWSDYSATPLLLMTAIALLLGILLIIPIGGADMPVVVSMLNSYSGWAAAATGFTLQNNLLIITGALVGFSGAILS